MAGRRTPYTDFEDRFFNLLEDTIQGIDKKVDDLGKNLADNTKRTDKGFRELGDRVTRVEGQVFRAVGSKWYQDNKLLWLALASVLVFLLILATILRVQIPTGLL